MPQKTYYSLAFSGNQAKRYYSYTTSDSTSYHTCNPNTCTNGPYIYDYSTCSGVTVYFNGNMTEACCYITNTSGELEVVTCPSCIWSST